MHAERTALDLAAVTAVIRYVRSLGPLAEPPLELNSTEFVVRYDVHLHRIPKDVFDAMLVVHDDLSSVRHLPDPERGDQYWAVRLEAEYATAFFYTEHEPLPGDHDA